MVRDYLSIVLDQLRNKCWLGFPKLEISLLLNYFRANNWVGLRLNEESRVCERIGIHKR